MKRYTNTPIEYNILGQFLYQVDEYKVVTEEKQLRGNYCISNEQIECPKTFRLWKKNLRVDCFQGLWAS